MSNPNDPATIMARHHPNEPQPGRLHRGCDRCMATWPCLPYRLAAENAALREQVQRLRADRDRPDGMTREQMQAALYRDQPKPEVFHSLAKRDSTNAAGTLYGCSGDCGWGWRTHSEDEAQTKWSDRHTHGEGNPLDGDQPTGVDA